MSEFQNPEQERQALISELKAKLNHYHDKLYEKDETGEFIIHGDNRDAILDQMEQTKLYLFSQRNFEENSQALRDYVRNHADDFFPSCEYVAIEVFGTEYAPEAFLPIVEEIFDEEGIEWGLDGEFEEE